jgi:hypothetical protein
MTIQAACEAARHVHSRSTVIESVPAPPLAPKLAVEDPTVAEQRSGAADGAVTLVEAELPHAIAERLNPAANAPAAMAFCRERVRPVTALAHAGKSPVSAEVLCYNQSTPAEQF